MQNNLIIKTRKRNLTISYSGLTGGVALCSAALFSVLAFTVPGIGIIGPIIMLGGLVFVHELGHFIAAKFMGMPVEVFSIGFGTRLCGFKWRETDVRLAVLPLGGYVKLSGYNPEEPGAEDPYGFLKQPAWKRVLFYSGGIIANVLACALLVYAVGIGSDRYPVQSVRLQVQEGSAAEVGGLLTGDELCQVDDLILPQANWNTEVVPYIRKHPEVPVFIQIVRDGQQMDFEIVPKLQGEIGILGITAMPIMSGTPVRPLHFRDFIVAVPRSLKETMAMGGMVIQGFWKLISFQSSFKELGGPIAIVQLGSEAAKAGWEVYFFMTAFISMNLAVLNALPIPIFDGGHICILAFERIRRKDISIVAKEKILTAGFYVIAALMAMVIFMDILRLKK